MVHNGHRQGLLLTDNHHQTLAAVGTRADEVALHHGGVLGEQVDHHSGVFTALALVDGAGLGGHLVIELAPAGVHHPAARRLPPGPASLVGKHAQFTVVGDDGVDGAHIVVEHFLLVIIGDLHHLIARRKPPAETLHLFNGVRVEQLLLLQIEQTRNAAAAGHRAQHLHLPERIETKAGRNALAHHLQDQGHRLLGCLGRQGGEVAALALSWGSQIGDGVGATTHGEELQGFQSRIQSRTFPISSSQANRTPEPESQAWANRTSHRTKKKANPGKELYQHQTRPLLQRQIQLRLLNLM
jgi:hypothetical protein